MVHEVYTERWIFPGQVNAYARRDCRNYRDNARETVSRLFSEFKKKQLIQAKGATLLIRSRFALEKIVQSY
jgi:hypothetical protein